MIPAQEGLHRDERLAEVQGWTVLHPRDVLVSYECSAVLFPLQVSVKQGAFKLL